MRKVPFITLNRKIAGNSAGNCHAMCARARNDMLKPERFAGEMCRVYDENVLANATAPGDCMSLRGGSGAESVPLRTPYKKEHPGNSQRFTAQTAGNLSSHSAGKHWHVLAATPLHTSELAVDGITGSG